MRLACLFSGGKDSVFALYKAVQAGHKVSCLITMKSRKTDSYMFHIPNIEFAKSQAEALNIPIVYMGSCGVKEKETMIKIIKNFVLNYDYSDLMNTMISKWKNENFNKNHSPSSNHF